MENSSAQELMNEAMLKLAEKAKTIGVALQFPPPFAKTLGMQIIVFEPPSRMVAQFPFNPAFTNPIGTLLGGMIPAYIDAVMGPLTYIAMDNPCVTTEISTSFIRPITSATKEFIVDTSVTAKTKRFVIVDAKIFSLDGKILASARSTSIIVKGKDEK